MGTTPERSYELTMSATRHAVSKRVGKSHFEIKELTEGADLKDFERCRHMRILSGSPGAWPWTDMMSGDDLKGPRRICSVSSCEKGPDILPEEVSSSKYFSIASMCLGSEVVEGWLGIIIVDVRSGM
jgi:hypothetical protein